MEESVPVRRIARFGTFEAELTAGELRKHGLKIPLQDQPFRLLTLLLERQGQVVGREELRLTLWPADTFVDFEHGLNTAVKKLRQALGDSAEQPRFIATHYKRGYCFIAPVTIASIPVVPPFASVGVSPLRRLPLWGAAGLALLGSVAVTSWWFGSGMDVDVMWPVPLTSYLGLELDPTFSPDGASVAFSWKKEDENSFHIYTKHLDADRPTQLTSGPQNDFSPAWSPDGRLIAFCRYRSGSRSEIRLVPAAGGPETRVADIYVVISSQSRPFLTWTPDSTSLVISDMEGAEPNASAESASASAKRHPACLFLLSIETGRRRKLTFPPDGWIGDSAPAFSPAARSLAFSRHSSIGLSEIYALSLSPRFEPIGTPRCLTCGRTLAANSVGTDDGRQILSPAWTSSGREILFGTGLPAMSAGVVRSSLWRIAVNGSSEPRRVEIAGEQAFLPTVSKQGDLAYVQATRDLNIWQIKLMASGSAALPPVRLVGSSRMDAMPRFSPDGKRIVFMSDRSGSMEVWTVNSDGSDPMQLTNMRSSVTGSPAWAPDGSRIIFDSNKGGRFQIYSVSVVGGSPQLLADMPANNAVASYSRDGRWIYFASNRTGAFQIWKMPAGGGSAVRVTKKGGRVAFESADGEFVYYATTVMDAQTNSLWRVPVSGGEETQVIRSAQPFEFVMTIDGIYFVPHNSTEPHDTVEFLSFSTSKISRVLSLGGPSGGGLSVSPDGHTLLYSQEDQRGADLVIVKRFH